MSNHNLTRIFAVYKYISNDLKFKVKSVSLSIDVVQKTQVGLKSLIRIVSLKFKGFGVQILNLQLFNNQILE